MDKGLNKAKFFIIARVNGVGPFQKIETEGHIVTINGIIHGVSPQTEKAEFGEWIEYKVTDLRTGATFPDTDFSVGQAVKLAAKRMQSDQYKAAIDKTLTYLNVLFIDAPINDLEALRKEVCLEA